MAFNKLEVGPWMIERMIERSLPVLAPVEIHARAFKFSNVVSWGLWLLYIILQLILATSLQQSSAYVLWHVWIIVAAEWFLSVQDAVTALNVILGLFSLDGTDARPNFRLLADTAPSLDVLITCCGESVDIVLDTAVAAATQDYPAGSLRIFVLDDAPDGELAHAVKMLKERIAHKHAAPIIYSARKKELGVRSYFKAGNINFGIKESKRLGGSELFAGLDADMIPERDWLRKSVPHLLLNDKLAMTVCPQTYYNVSADDPLGQYADFEAYFSGQELLNDRLGASMCTGTGYVARRTALEEIGGWPLAETGEDFMCSALLGSVGWEIAYVRENLQYGLAPSSFRSIIRQRMRWIDACMEVCQYFGYYLPGSAMTAQMTIMQRAVNILYAFRDYSPMTSCLALLLLPIAVLLRYSTDEDAPLRVSSPGSQHQRLRFWIQALFVAAYISHALNTHFMYRHIGTARMLNFASHQVYASPYMAYRNLVSLLPLPIRPASTFFVCGALTNEGLNERSSSRRAPLHQRLLSLDMLFYMIYAFLIAVAVVLRLQVLASSNGDSGGEGNIEPFVIMGALVKCVDCIFKVLVPVRYMISPPTDPGRETWMEEDEQGVRRVKKDEIRKEGRGNGVWWLLKGGCEVGVMWICWR